jgi:phosphoesterase RecJ-like protein
MLGKAWEEIKKSDNIVLISHINPDGDTLGSTLALFDVLKKMDKNVSLFNVAKTLPKKYSFLKNYEQIANSLPVKIDTIITCDCATLKRAGINEGDYKIINIDHHATNLDFGDENLVLRDSSSTAMVLYKMFKHNNVDFSKDAATALYVGIVDDTNFFTSGNLDEKTFLNVSDIISRGADMNLVSSKLTQNVSLAKFRLHEHAMSKIDLLKNGKVANVVIWQSDLERTGAKREDTEELANLIRSLVSVEFSFLILEEKNGTFKISLRSKPNSVDVSKIAFKFGGGGHYVAAGFESEILDTKELVSKILHEYDKEKSFVRIQEEK